MCRTGAEHTDEALTKKQVIASVLSRIVNEQWKWQQV
jgi:hypothetical protein